MSNTAAFVLAAPLARTWDRRPRSLEPHLVAVYRVGAVVTVLLVAAAALVGEDVVELVLGGSLDAGDPRTIVSTFLALSGVLLAGAALPVPLLAAFANGRYVGVAVVAAAALVLQTAVSAGAEAAGELELLGLAASAGALAFLALVAYLTWRSELGHVLALLARELARPLALAVLAYGPALALALAVPGAAVRAVAAAVATIAFLRLLRARLPEHHELLMRLVRPGSGGGAPAL
jgi:hypothetical protein